MRGTMQEAIYVLEERILQLESRSNAHSGDLTQSRKTIQDLKSVAVKQSKSIALLEDKVETQYNLLRLASKDITRLRGRL